MNNPSLRAQWESHNKAQRDLIRAALDTAQSWIETATDRVWGNIGALFTGEFKSTGCTQNIDVRYRGLAHYTSFSLAKKDGGFINNITYGPPAVEDLAHLYSSMVHEQTHAIQKSKCAALHASPFNPGTRIVICPKDWILLQERCEQGAYTMQALFNSLLAESIPEIKDMSAKDALSVDDFEALRNPAPYFVEAMREIAHKSLDKSFYSDNPNAEKRFRNYYHELSLDGYIAGIDSRLKDKENIIFVRAEPEDIAAIGDVTGFNLFGYDTPQPEFAAHPKLLAKTAKKLAETNLKLGIADESALPSLSEALAAIGLTRAQFLAASYAAPESPTTRRTAAPRP